MLNTYVGDLMIPMERYPHVKADDTLLDVMKTIQNNWIEIGEQKTPPFVILVLGESDQIVGMASLNNILHGLEPKFHVKRSIVDKLIKGRKKDQQTNIQIKRIIRGIMEHSERRIGEIMLPIGATIDHDEHIFSAVDCISECKISLIPVVKDGKVVGVLRSVDIFNTISNALLKEDYVW